ncbi:MAG: DNA polymerase III subunit gamma/tau [Desulfobacterales bacterium]|nr:MAG: DNA polymerase III subunit gamma/tau [Desulfobacterales bacterium]
MSYLALARKYRPQTFEEVVKQEHVTQTLANAISTQRVAHAILLSGPRGTGKTTVARILAKAMNCKEGPIPKPCNRCNSCKEITRGSAVDVFEIDGASNNSVDQVRELRENVKYMPAHSAYKIYIIDEVHMLSIAAFNALLKTLEEPPPHIMFVFATTEPRKIPITILSRCQRHDFRRIDVDSIANHLVSICSKEGVNITVESLGLLAREASGSMRDGLSLIDHVMSCTQGDITQEQILDILGVLDRDVLFNMSKAILHKNLPEILDILDDVYSAGHDMKKFYADLIEHFRNLLVLSMGKNSEKLIDLPAHEIDLMQGQTKGISQTFLSQIFNLLFQEEGIISHSVQPKLAIEMVFVKIFQIKPALPIDVLIKKLDTLKKEINTDPKDTNLTASRPAYQDDEKGFVEAPTETAGTAESVTQFTAASIPRDENYDKIWREILVIFLNKHPSLAANLKNSAIIFMDGARLEIEVNGNEFNINMVKKDKNLAIIKQVCRDYFRKDIEVVVKIKKEQTNDARNKKSQADQLKQEALSHPLVSDAIEIFDGKVVDIKIL